MPSNFPPPWTLHELPEAWVVKDANGFNLAYFYFGSYKFIGTTPDRMTRQQAYALAVNFSRLPVWMGKG